MRSPLERRPAALAFAVGLGCLIASASPVGAQAANGGSVSEGASVYGSMCGRCHNPRSPLERTDRAWVTIANHMRARGNLTGKEVRNVLAFLQATNSDPRERAPLPGATAVPTPATGEIRSGPPASDPTLVTRGMSLTGEKACLGCHVVGKRGGEIGPTLNGVVARKGADFVRQKLANPTFNTSTSLMPNFGLSTDEIEAIVAYLNTLRGR